MSLFQLRRSAPLLPLPSWQLAIRQWFSHSGIYPKITRLAALLAAAVVMVIGIKLGLASFSVTSVAFGASTLLGIRALLLIVLQRLAFPAAANWPWLGLAAVLLSLILPELLVLLVDSAAFGWLLLVILVASVIYTLCSQLLLFEQIATMIGWNMLLCLPLLALCLGLSLGNHSHVTTSSVGLAGMVLFGVGYWWFWSLLLKHTARP